LVTDLEDLQNTLKLFSVCTAHKVTHLSSPAVYNTPLGELPNNYWLWDSAMTTQFSAMTSNLIAHITNATALPTHAQLMSNISINRGGHAITSYMTNSKRCLGFNKTHPQFPPAIKLLYNDWESSTNRSWTIFRKYLPTFNETTIAQSNSHDDYIYKASLNGSQEKMKEHSSRQLKSKVLFNADISSQHVQQVLPALLYKRTSMALMTMSRIPKEHRIKNQTFCTALQRKLRLPIINNTTDYKCRCGAILDPSVITASAAS
jgi:hypothetical protein